MGGRRKEGRVHEYAGRGRQEEEGGEEGGVYIRYFIYLNTILSSPPVTVRPTAPS